MQSMDALHDITNGAIAYAAQQMQRKEVQAKVKAEVVGPLIALLYQEIYPYLIMLGTAVMLILVFTILTFVLFVLAKFK